MPFGLIPHHADILEELYNCINVLCFDLFSSLGVAFLNPLYTDRGLKISFILANNTEPDKLTYTLMKCCCLYLHCLPNTACSVVVDSLLIVTPIVGFCNCSMFCYALLCVHSSFAIILMGKRELVALLCLSSWCLVIVVWLFLTMPRVCLQFVIVVFPDHTHLLFFTGFEYTNG